MKTKFLTVSLLWLLASCGQDEAKSLGPGTEGGIQVTNTAAETPPVILSVNDVIDALVEVTQDPNTGSIEVIVDNDTEEGLVLNIVHDIAPDANLLDLREQLEMRIRQLEKKLWGLLHHESDAPGKNKEIERTEVELALNHKLLLQVERLLM